MTDASEQVGGHIGVAREIGGLFEKGDQEGNQWCRYQESLRDNHGTRSAHGIETPKQLAVSQFLFKR